MKKQNSKVNNKLIIMLIILDLLLLSVFIYSFSDTKSDKQTGEVLKSAFNSSPVFNSSIICYDPILSKKDNNQDWCERECRINNMTKIKYTSKGTDIICACKDKKGQIALKKVFE